MVGIEAINVFAGTACLDVGELAQHRQLDIKRFNNLLMKEKSVALPNEDPVSFAVNAAKPIIDSLSSKECERIELLITCSESGIDFGKSISNYVHHYLGLNRNCRMFEIKQACYSGTAGLQMAIGFILSQASPGARALVIASDISRFILPEEGNLPDADWSYAEPTSGAGAVALLISEYPRVVQMDIGANGYYGYEVMDTCRPIPDSEAGDADLSLMSYLDCCEQSYLEYQRRVEGVDYRHTFQYLAFHTPFGGMVKGAHRTMMRKMNQAKAAEVETDFQNRVMPGLSYCQRVGNIMGGTVLMSLAGIIDQAEISASSRIGIFSYGSGCCSEFYSGMTSESGQLWQQQFAIPEHLDGRYRLSMDEYENILKKSAIVRFGTRNVEPDRSYLASGRTPEQKAQQRLFLREIRDYHREYEWR